MYTCMYVYLIYGKEKYNKKGFSWVTKVYNNLKGQGTSETADSVCNKAVQMKEISPN